MSDSAQQAKAQKKAYDEACKRVLSERGIMAHILKACTEEFKDCDLQDIAQRYIQGEPSISRIAVELEAISPRIESEQTEDKASAGRRNGLLRYPVPCRSSRGWKTHPAHHQLGSAERFQSGLSLVEASCLLLRTHDFQSVWDSLCEISLRKNPEGLFHLDLHDANEKMGVQYFKVSAHGRPFNGSYTGRTKSL